MITVPLKDRIRMYLLVTLLCAVLAMLFRFFLTGTAPYSNYAEEQLNAPVGATVQAEPEALPHSALR